MTKDNVSLLLGHCIPAPSSHRFLLFARLLLADNVLDFWMTEQLKIHCFDFMPGAQTEDNLWRRLRARQHTLTLHFFHSPSRSWHPLSRLTSPAHLFAFSCLSRWTFIVFHYTVEEQERSAFYLLDPGPACPCILSAASLQPEWTLHTVSGLTLHCCVHSLHTEVRLPCCTHTHTLSHTNQLRNGQECTKERRCICMCITQARATPDLSDVNSLWWQEEVSAGGEKAEQWR